MAIINSNSIESLVQTWLKAEEQGERFPVPFEDAWAIAGYSRKDVAKRKLEAFFDEDLDYSTELRIGNRGGKPEHLINLSCDTLKEFCMVSKTDVGKATRRYFIEAEKKWKLVEQYHPEVAKDIERIKLELELIKAKTYYMDRRDAIRTIHGDQVLALLDGRPDAVVDKIEKVTETIICKDGRTVSFEGRSTAEIGKELGFKTGKELERWLEKIGLSGLICQGFRINQAPYIPTENLQKVKQVFAQNKNRQLLIGE